MDINAVMPVEAQVLRGDKGVLHMLRNAVYGDPHAVFPAVQRSVLRVYGNYDRFCGIAEGLVWKNAVMQVFALPPDSTETCVMYLVRFRERFYNLESGLVQAMLMKCAAEEPDAPDFRQTAPAERSQLLREQSALYRRCVSPASMRMKPLSGNSMLREILSQLPVSTVLPEPARKVVWEGVSYDIGSSAGCRSLLSVNGMSVLLTDCTASDT